MLHRVHDDWLVRRVVERGRRIGDGRDPPRARLREPVEREHPLVLVAGAPGPGDLAERLREASEREGERGPLGVQGVERVERGTVYSMELRKDVRWHPGAGHTDQMLDARDAIRKAAAQANFCTNFVANGRLRG